MTKSKTGVHPGHAPGDSIEGYIVKRAEHIEELSSVFYELEHERTGARHLHLGNNDKENVFSAAFKTIPSDSTGVAHILEHTVLCGSKKFPVRDPFFSMLKRSLSTFMNAFTASDWTMYPFSTQNRNDFFNLMSVYLDSAFFPLIDELSFKQEGCRLDWDESDAKPGEPKKLVYKGIVYNEMKGAMSSPSQVMGRSLLNALYPDVTYRFNSGGEPEDIPTLSHDALKQFHKRHYHPGNSFFYTYGNIPLEESLAFINETVLKKFDGKGTPADVPPQPRWDAPKTATYSYPLGPDEAPEKKCQICVAWLMADIVDSFEILTLKVLNGILMGNSASPLRKALIDMELGSDLCDGSGFDDDNRDSLFVCGLKDVAESDAEKIESKIFDVLNELVSKGIDPEIIESAIHQIEFHRKEVKNIPYPHGINLLIKLSGTWFHGGDPISSLLSRDGFDAIRKRVATEKFFEKKITSYFIENRHRVLFKLVPDKTETATKNRRTEKTLEAIRKQLSPSDIEKMEKSAEALKNRQEEIEDVSCLPIIQLSDIEKSVEIIAPTSSGRRYTQGEGSKHADNAGDLPIYYYDRPTSGILYFHGSSSPLEWPERLIPLVPFFCFAFSRVGTNRSDYAQIAKRIDSCAGGLGLFASARTPFDQSGACMPVIGVNGKCLVRNQRKMFELMDELFFDGSFGDHLRLKSLLSQYRAIKESSLIENGHMLAISLSSRQFSPARALGEKWGGVSQFKFIKQISDDLSQDRLAEDRLASMARDLSAIGKIIFARDRFKMAVAGEDSSLAAAASPIAALYEKLEPGGDTPSGDALGLGDAEKPLPFEGWSASSAVSFVAQSFKTERMGHPDAPALSVISKLLRSLFLHREIREKGGAYGGFARYSGEEGIFSFASYRDPRIAATLDVYAAAAKFICSGDYTEENVREGILQVCSEIDKPDPPGPAAIAAFNRNVISLSDETRLAFKTALLSLNRAKIITVANRHFTGDPSKQGIAVISGETQLAEANKTMTERPLNLFKI